MKKHIILMVVVALLFALTACGNKVTTTIQDDRASVEVHSNDNDEVSTQQIEDNLESHLDSEMEDDVEPEVEPKKEPNSEITKYNASTYRIGLDMPAGEYVLFSESKSGYFQLTKDSSGSVEAIIANNNFETNTIVTVFDDQYLTMKGCYAVPIGECKDLDFSNSGMFKVGYHIPAGEYKIEVDEESLTGFAYVQVSTDSTHSLESIMTNDNFEGAKYITVSMDQYLTLTGCHIISRPLMASDINADQHTIVLLLAKDDYNGYLNGNDNLGNSLCDMWTTLTATYSSFDEIYDIIKIDYEKYVTGEVASFADYWKYASQIYTLLMSEDAERSLGSETYQALLQSIISLVETN